MDFSSDLNVSLQSEPVVSHNKAQWWIQDLQDAETQTLHIYFANISEKNH